jgi:hypothetical protein
MSPPYKHLAVIHRDDAGPLMALTKMSGDKLGVAVYRFHNGAPVSYWHETGIEQRLEGHAELPFLFLSWPSAERRRGRMIVDKWSSKPAETAGSDGKGVEIVAWICPDWYPEQQELSRYRAMERFFPGGMGQR